MACLLWLCGVVYQDSSLACCSLTGFVHSFLLALVHEWNSRGKISGLNLSLPLANSFITLFTSALEIACLNAFSPTDCSHSEGSTV